MMGAIARHLLLLMTFRHPLTGLDVRGRGHLLMLLSISVTTSALRWDMGTAAGHGLLLMVFYLLVPLFAVAVALFSTGLDLLAIPIEFALEQKGLAIFGIWELTGTLVIGYRLFLSNNRRAKR